MTGDYTHASPEEMERAMELGCPDFWKTGLTSISNSRGTCESEISRSDSSVRGELDDTHNEIVF